MSRKNKTTLLLLVFALVAFSLFVYIRNANRKPPLSYKTFQTPNGWGYRVFAADTMLVIQQETIPGMEGTRGFDSEQKAARTAAFVIYKIRKGNFPPTVEKKELDSLEVL